MFERAAKLITIFSLSNFLVKKAFTQLDDHRKWKIGKSGSPFSVQLSNGRYFYFRESVPKQ